MAASEVLVVAGEASGDLHGARLLSELTRLRPDLHAYGLGGDEMQAGGFEALAHSAEISVVGLFEVLKILARARQIFRQILDEVDRRGTRHAILIDFPDFNLRLARQLKRRGIEVIYYISPQVWAWRRGRVRAIARDVALMMVLFPFEEELYKQHGVEVVHVGHPLVDEVPILESSSRDTTEELTLALLPGSRRSEVQVLLPVMLAAVRHLAAWRPLHARIIQAPTISEDLLRPHLATAEGVSGLRLSCVRRDRFQAISDADLALVASGTATLEVGLLGTPMIVIYRLTRWTYWLGRLLVDLPSFSLVNLVLASPVVPELLQDEAEGDRICAEARSLLESPDRLDRMRQRLQELRPRLGEGGASRRAAQELAVRRAAQSTVSAVTS